MHGSTVNFILLTRKGIGSADGNHHKRFTGKNASAKNTQM